MDKIYCPYCGLNNDFDSFLPNEIIEQAKEIAYNWMIEQLNQTFGKMTKDINTHQGIVKMRYKTIEEK